MTYSLSPLLTAVIYYSVSVFQTQLCRNILDFSHDISHKFEKGKIYAIIGPNGSGKTTFLKLLGRLREPTEGKITLDEKDFPIDENAPEKFLAKE